MLNKTPEEQILIKAAAEIAEMKLKMYWLVHRICQLDFYRADGITNRTNTEFQHWIAQDVYDRVVHRADHIFFMTRPEMVHHLVRHFHNALERITRIHSDFLRSQKHRVYERLL